MSISCHFGKAVRSGPNLVVSRDLIAIAAFDRRNILLGNALQVWKIVKATFSNEVFGNFDGTDCESMSSAGAQLGCLWQRATPFLSYGSQKSDDSNTTDEVLTSLTSVSMASTHDDVKLMDRIVYSACTGYHEQHG